VWGNGDGDNVVWGNCQGDGCDNVVWGNSVEQVMFSDETTDPTMLDPRVWDNVFRVSAFNVAGTR
jgi:hypothetical protein